MIRRWLAVIIAFTAMGWVGGSPAQAAPADWEGSRITSTAAFDSTFDLTAVLVRDYPLTSPATYRVRASMEMTAPPGLPETCTSSVGPQEGPTRRTSSAAHDLSAPATATCNGRYAVAVSARLERRSCGQVTGVCGTWSTIDTHVIEGAIDVAAPAPAPAAVAATEDGSRSVLVTWTPAVDAPPDFLGYQITRTSSAGTRLTLDTVDADAAPSYTDTQPPGIGGPTTYTVRGRRAGPNGEVLSDGASATADVTPDPTAPADPGAPKPPSSPPPGSSGGDVPTTDSPNPTTPGSSGPARVSPSLRTPAVGRTSGTFPPLRAPDVDNGYDESLPYDDAEPGDRDPVLPDGLSLALNDNVGQGLLVPGAAGLLMVVWALHLRFLSHASRPDPAAHDDLPEITIES